MIGISTNNQLQDERYKHPNWYYIPGIRWKRHHFGRVYMLILDLGG